MTIHTLKRHENENAMHE